MGGRAGEGAVRGRELLGSMLSFDVSLLFGLFVFVWFGFGLVLYRAGALSHLPGEGREGRERGGKGGEGWARSISVVDCHRFLPSVLSFCVVWS